MNHIELGRRGEIEACNYLRIQGYRIIAKNYKCKSGEIDIIAVDDTELVFIEVKTRCSKKYGEPREAVNQIKKKHIKKAASYYIHQNALENEYIRFDVVEVYFRNEKFFIKQIKNTLW